MTASVRGFTLIEMTLVVLIIALLSTAALAPLSVQLEARARRQTEARLDAAVTALYGFAATHGRLPCPDDPADGDGREDRFGERACRVHEGTLPHVDLALGATDAWGRRLRYRLTTVLDNAGSGANFAATDDGFCAADDGDLDLCELGDIEIRGRGDNPATALREGKYDHALADRVPAVVVSHGANGYGALLSGATRVAPGRNGDERANADGDRIFYARQYAAARPACADDERESQPLCEFDDLLRWLAPTILNDRLISAGRLP